MPHRTQAESKQPGIITSRISYFQLEDHLYERQRTCYAKCFNVKYNLGGMSTGCDEFKTLVMTQTAAGI